jgi:ATP-dependent DNA ligase
VSPIAERTPLDQRFLSDMQIARIFLFGVNDKNALCCAIPARFPERPMIKQPTRPFVNLPEKTPGRWRQGITPAVMKLCHWVEPVLVAQIKFTEWTSGDQLRQPVFLGLRADNKAKDAVRG